MSGDVIVHDASPHFGQVAALSSAVAQQQMQIFILLS